MSSLRKVPCENGEAFQQVRGRKACLTSSSRDACLLTYYFWSATQIWREQVWPL